MKNKNLIKEELRELPFLKEQFDKPEGYQVPNDYFKHLEKNILDQVKKNTAPDLVVRTKLFSLSNIWSKAAAIILLVGGSLFIWQKNIPPTIASTIDLSTEEIYTYITDNLQEFDEDILLDQVYSDQSIAPLLSEEEKEFFLEELMEDNSFDLEEIL